MRAARHTQIHLVCHGEFVGAEMCFPAARSVSLTAAGREQAQHVADFIAARRPSCLYTSPLRRALETAEAIAARLEFAPKVRPDLRGGRPVDPDELALTAARASSELGRIARLHRGEQVVCVTHQDVIVASVLRYSGRSYAACDEVPVGFGSVWTLSLVGGHVGVRYVDHGEIASRVAAVL